MAIRTALLNGNNISRDTDFSKYIETVSEPGVIEGLEVSATKVGIGKARVPCERTNGETIYALVYNSSEATISGNGDVYIQVSQTYIDDGELANEDGTGIATIEVGTTPSKNALKLATITSGTPVDERNMIPKVGELSTQIDTIFTELEDLDERVEKLEEAGAIDHLEESGLVGELYSLSDTLFKQNTPALADSSLDCNVGDTAANTQIHIQRIGSGTASDTLKLKVKKVGSPTQNLIVEVRKGIKVEVSSSEAYWYGDEVIASGSIAYGDITTDYAEATITLNASFGGTKGQLLDIVVYQASNTVNASNYFCVACDSTQYSEGFSYVSVNGSTRTRSKLMPYGISEGFAQSLFCKGQSSDIILGNSTRIAYNNTCYSQSAEVNYTFSGTGELTIGRNQMYIGGDSSYFYVSLDGVKLLQIYGGGNFTDSQTFVVSTPGTHTLKFLYHVASSYINSSVSYEYANFTQKIIHKKGTNIPIETKSVGNNTSIMVLGNNQNTNFNPFFMGIEVSSATTGSITPGNFVGYLDIGGYKIPYYK